MFLRKALEGYGVAMVVNSDNPNFKPGDFVAGITGWEDYSLIRRTEQLRKITPDDDIPLSFHFGLLGNIIMMLFLFHLTILFLKHCLAHENKFVIHEFCLCVNWKSSWNHIFSEIFSLISFKYTYYVSDSKI